jgi:hypothetical protein
MQYILQPTTRDIAENLFGESGKKERVAYTEGKNTDWYLFGHSPTFPGVGHAVIAKIGVGDKDSSHYRFGRWFISPEYRGTSNGPIYAGLLIYYYLKNIMTTDYRIFTLRAWDELVPRYENNGWINTGKSFKGPFQELRKTFCFSYGKEKLLEIKGWKSEECSGIIYPGDYKNDYHMNTF